MQIPLVLKKYYGANAFLDGHALRFADKYCWNSWHCFMALI